MTRKPFHKRPAWSIVFFDLTLIPWLKAISKPFIDRKPFAAFIATIATHPIAGMLYLGRWKRAIVYIILSQVFFAAEVYMRWNVSWFPHPPFYILDVIFLRLIAGIDAYHIARSWQRPAHMPFYMRWYGAIFFWLLAVACISLIYMLLNAWF